MDPELKVSGDDMFVYGANSYISPAKLQAGTYVAGMNVMCRGGIVQTRPGSRSLVQLPLGNLQGVTFFQPTSGLPSLVAAVDGKVYTCPYPFNAYKQIDGIQFSPYSKYIAWASCVQSTYTNDAGEIKVLETPANVLLMADGVTKSAYWDGSTGRHLNPLDNETPVGLWMVWSNNRLWISRDSQVFASDIGNPLSFTEGTYLNEGRAFYLPGKCTGIAETVDRLGILCFTNNSGDFIKSSIQNRTQWLNTEQFQQTILPDVGCVAPRSIVQQYGLLWWYSANGLINQDAAQKTYITSRIDIQDNEMYESKYTMSYDLSGIAGGTYENFLLQAVPSGDKWNTRVHVLDQAQFSTEVSGWPGYWTGWRPVEFTSGVIGSQKRIFCVSVDYDGSNRIWEMFRSDKTDNGIPITCFVATRLNLFENRDYKQFRYLELELTNLSGPVAITAGIRGTRGAFQKVLSKDIAAGQGQVYYESLYGYDSNQFAGSRTQNRIIRSIDSSNASECNAGCVESRILGLVDKGFSAVVAWSGIAGIAAYRIFSQSVPQAYQGNCESDEDGPNVVTPEGCAIQELFWTDGQPWEEYYGKATFTQILPDGSKATKTITQQSFINQQDANRRAMTTAEWYVGTKLGTL